VVIKEIRDMKELSKITRVEWRGSVHRKTESTDDERDEFRKGRVTLLLGSGGNRGLLADHLSQFFDLVEPSGPLLKPGSFDIAIVDIEGLRQWQKQLLDAKLREEPTFLPVVLVVSNSELRHRLKLFGILLTSLLSLPLIGENLQSVYPCFLEPAG
jgi:hypothetical protein